MCVCTFFGHKDCPDSIKERLWETLKELIVNHHVDMFYVGNQGRFDAFVPGVVVFLRSQRALAPG